MCILLSDFKIIYNYILYSMRFILQIFQDLVLYLWRFHSAVSLRVSALHSCEDSDRRWPPTSLCPTCWDASAEPWVVLDEAQRLAETKWGAFWGGKLGNHGGWEKGLVWGE